MWTLLVWMSVLLKGKGWWWWAPCSPLCWCLYLEGYWKSIRKKESFLLPALICLWFFISSVIFTGLLQPEWKGAWQLSEPIRNKRSKLSNTLHYQFSRFFRTHGIVYNCAFCAKNAENNNWTCLWSSSRMFFFVY